MRVTNGMMVDHVMRNLQNNLRRMDRLSEQLSSGRRIQVPSDDPAGAAEALRLQSALGETKQYRQNIEDAVSWMNSTDAALAEMGSALQRARELAVYGSTDSLSNLDRQAIADEVDQLLQHLVQVGNTQHGGRYIFAGQQTLTAPFAATVGAVPGGVGGALGIVSVSYQGDTGTIESEIAPGITMRWNTPGNDVFQPAFDALISLRDNLRSGNSTQISQVDLANLDQAVDSTLRWRADNGAKVNRLEVTKGRLDDLEVNLTKLVSKVEDADIAEVVMQLAQAESVYKAALGTGARIIQPTLLDFLR